MPSPLISIVIPTHGRPELLPVAVRSALDNAGSNVEVIVIPNGPDHSYKQSLAEFSDDDRVRMEPISTANGNVARNHGMALARGKYLRFLDDDDQLLPAAREQILIMEKTAAEICSGAIAKVNEAGITLGHMAQRDDADLVCAMARPERICLPTAHVFLRSALTGMTWRESLKWEQDTDWMLGICAAREWKWASISETVGSWTQHSGSRVSQGVTKLARARSNFDLFRKTVESLDARKALTEARADAFSEALWNIAHVNFHTAPIFSTAVARTAMRLNPKRNPPDAFYESGIGSKINPLIFEYLLIPQRFLKELTRRYQKNAGRRSGKLHP